jgi:glutamate synthase domain-containing protein 2
MNNSHDSFLYSFLTIFASLFVLAIGVIIIAIIVLYFIDIRQNTHTIRRNSPVIGRFRYIFEKMGEFFRQYFFALDREEMPFNRAERSWAYRAAKGENNTIAFGSTRDLRAMGTILFVNTPFPTLDENATKTRDVTIGPYCENPYHTDALVNISAMSFGALSQPAVEALSAGAKQCGSWLNTGEGGVSPHHLKSSPDIVFQIGTAKYGVRASDGSLDDAKLADIAKKPEIKMIELKISQGAKPGKGGILPAIKVTDEIAAIRGIPAGKASISPNRHLDIKCNSDLLDAINHLRDVSKKPVGFKTVLGGSGWISELCESICERGIEFAPDFITLDGGDGGTGASPMPLMDNVGLPLRESLPLLVDELVRYGLKDRIKVIASGKLITPSEVAWALCMGADFVNTARGAMFALGCIQAMQCNKNTCPTGITTHDKDLQKGLVPEVKAERVARYLENLSHDVCVIAHSVGIKEPREFTRKHARMMTSSGHSQLLSELYPLPTPIKS